MWEMVTEEKANVSGRSCGQVHNHDDSVAAGQVRDKGRPHLCDAPQPMTSWGNPYMILLIVTLTKCLL